MLRDRLDEIEAQTERDKEWWEKRRASIKNEFMKELDEEEEQQQQQQQQSKAGTDDEGVLVDTPNKKKKGKKGTA